MSASQVFRPSNGPIFLRNTIEEGPAPPPIKSGTPSGGRPASSSGRFGTLSINSFFARHSPHPGRVKHIKGLLDVPICAVNDSGYLSNPRYALKFPPNNFDQTKLLQHNTYLNVPVNAINVNSQRWPIDTINGLQYFVGKPLNMRIFRDKAIPQVGMVPVTETWREELRALTEGITLPKPAVPERDETRPRTSQYSANTGRLIPPPSRQMSRQGSRLGSRHGRQDQLHHLSSEPDVEGVVLQMLCQILQSDDVSAVQAWLVSAGEREKAMVMDMIRAALATSEEYHKKTVPQEGARSASRMQEREVLADGILGASDKADRLNLDKGPARAPPHLPAIDAYDLNGHENGGQPPPSRNGNRPPSRRTSMSRAKPTAEMASKSEKPVKLRFTNSPGDAGNGDTWRPSTSLVPSA